MPRVNRGTRLADKPNASGHWVITWTEDGRSNRISTGKASRKEAEIVLAGFILETSGGAAAPEAPARSLTIADLLDAYERERIEARAVDVERALMAGKPIREFFGRMAPENIQAAHTSAYGSARRLTGRVKSDATIRRELQHLRAAILWGLRQRRISADSVPHIDMPPRVEPRSRTLTDTEVARILSVRIEAKPTKRETDRGCTDAPRLSRVHRFIALMLMAPARPEAIRRLTWFQVDLEKRQIDYRLPGRAVTKKRRTVVPISAALMPILRRAAAERFSAHVLDEPGEIKHAFATAMREAGCPDVTPYVLRHTWATRAVAAGVPIAHVARLLGDTVATVERNYVHLTPDHLRGAVEDAWNDQRNAPIADDL
jgi:integrase